MMRNSTPNSEAYMKKLTPLAALNPREWNSWAESMGVVVRRSQPRKAPTRRPPNASAATVCALAQPTSLARIRPR